MINAGRIDIIEDSPTRDFTIVENKDNLQQREISWLKDKSGIVMDNLKPEGAFRLKTDKDMELTFQFKGIDKKINNKQIEYWVEFYSFCVEGNEIYRGGYVYGIINAIPLLINSEREKFTKLNISGGNMTTLLN